MRTQNTGWMAGFFGKMCAYVGGSCVLLTLFTGSVIPLVVGAVALFTTLSFLNGLGSGNTTSRLSYAR